MMRHRIIPVLLLKDAGLYKGKKFKDHRYVGDPINAIKVFNDKEVDELVFLDITTSMQSRQPDFALLHDIASECFMPLGYGGGVSSVDMIREILKVGIEKAIVNTHAVRNPEMVRSAVRYFGTSTIVASIDVRKNIFGAYQVYICSGQEKTRQHPVTWAKELENMGVGEIIINSIDKDGTQSGYDHELVRQVSQAVKVPVIALGGASDNEDFVKVCKSSGASAAAAGARFVFQGRHDAVLITYPKRQEIQDLFDKER